MKVCIPVDVAGIHPHNPYVPELIKGLERQGCQVMHGLFRVGDVPDCDIINIHWPEALCSWHEPSSQDLDDLSHWLLTARKRSRIVVTVHNEAPHYKGSSRYTALYKLVYENAAACVHLGKRSVELLSTYPVLHHLIPHGNYAVYGPQVARDEARQRLGLPSDKQIVLVIGTLRSVEEIGLIKQFADALDPDSLLLMQGNLPLLSRYRHAGDPALIRRLSAMTNELRMRMALKINRNVIYRPGEVDFHRIRDLVCACDVLLIPRLRSLNSGLLQLGFTYGRVVLGPAIGNVGKELQDTGNPAFSMDPGNKDHGARLAEALSLSKTGLPADNATMAREQWHWDKVSAQYLALFGKVLESHV
jgi:hypothetical protein